MLRKTVSPKTLNNWLLDAGLLASALATIASSLYFLYAPSGGYRGGRNTAYNAVLLFSRTTWDDLHTWGGLAMIVVALVHIVIHWSWVISMAKRVWREVTGRSASMNTYGHFNVAIDALIALTFILASASGIYFLFAGGSHGGTNPDPLFLFPRATWDLLHTWSGVGMILAALVHFAIHWRWVVKVTGKVFGGLLPNLALKQPRPAAQ
jgi:hypothetical protein